MDILLVSNPSKGTLFKNIQATLYNEIENRSIQKCNKKCHKKWLKCKER